MDKVHFVEKVNEIIFMPLGIPDSTISGLFYMDVRDKFPIKTARPQLQLMLPSLMNPNERELLVEDLTQFKSTDSSIVKQAGHSLVTTNALKELDWVEYKNEIKDTYLKYSKLFQPQRQIRLISLKYLYKIYVDSFTELESFKNIKITTPLDQEYEKIKSVNITTEFEMDDGSISAFNMSSVFSDVPGKIQLVFEFNSFMNIPESINDSNIDSWLDIANNSILDSFSNIFKK